MSNDLDQRRAAAIRCTDREFEEAVMSALGLSGKFDISAHPSLSGAKPTLKARCANSKLRLKFKAGVLGSVRKTRRRANSGAAGGPSVRTKFTGPAPKIGAILESFDVSSWRVLSAKPRENPTDHSPTQRGVNTEALRLSSCERLTAFRPASWRRHPSIHRAMCRRRACLDAHAHAHVHSAWVRAARQASLWVTALHAALHAAHGALHAALHVARPAALAVLAPPGTSLSPLGCLHSGPPVPAVPSTQSRFHAIVAIEPVDRHHAGSRRSSRPLGRASAL